MPNQIYIIQGTWYAGHIDFKEHHLQKQIWD